ncbi:MAG TPA: 7-carboxy-7-deazaguanine synthase [Rhizomicrobium sp.]|nr:7-carboxy-7-deazaguanine synthase [Rhizomicrobium sp.]
MTYSVKEIYYTLQGEGAQTGRPAVFLRFAGCNLWNGLERDRAEAVCRFCDTDFVGTDGPNGGKFSTAADLARAAKAQWPDRAGGKPYVVCTGGEPLLQLDDAAIAALNAEGFEIGIETNGTLLPPAGIDWICVSPKAGSAQILTGGDELKLVFPQAGAPPERFADQQFSHFFLQPLDDENRAASTQAAIAYCLKHPQWRLSIQTHKLLGIP